MRPHRFVAYITLLAVLGIAALLPGRVPEVGAQDGLPTVHQAFVSVEGINKVAIIDTDSNALISRDLRMPTHPGAGAITPDGTRLFVPHIGNPGAVLGFDTQSLEQVMSIPLEASDLRGAAITPDGTRLFIADNGRRTVTALDLRANSILTTIPLEGHPEQIALSPDGSRLYVAANHPDLNYVIDTNALSIINTFQSGIYPSGIVVSPDGLQVYVANAGDSTVTVFATADQHLVQIMPTQPGSNALLLTPDGKKLYCTNFASKSLSVLDVATQTTIATLGLNSHPMVASAATADGSRIYVPLDGGQVAVIDGLRNVVLTNIDTGGRTMAVMTPPPPTATAVPPTATAVPPTATVVPPTATAVPPTATAVPPTATAVPPTATAVPSLGADWQTPTGSPQAEHQMTGQIAYVREKNLYLLDLATRTTHQLTSDGKDSNPAWSPDGQWLAFARDSDIYKLRVEGTAAGALVQVTTTSEKELLPSYSREGTLFFIHMTTDDSGYPRYDIIGKTDDREYIAYNSAQSDLIGFFEPSSLDFFSDHLFALTEPQPSNVQVYVVDIASGEPHVSLISTSLVQRAPFSWVAYEGRWSHQKGELAFTASESSSSASSAGMLRSTMLGHKAFDGSNAPVIPIWSAEAGSDDWTSLDWSPDDQWLALARWRDDGLWVISAQGGEPQRIADVGSQPAWRPTVAISPPAATLPTTVTDLALTLGSESGTVQLTWTAPSSKEDVAALSYDLRYSEQPINEQTWDSAIEVANEPTVAATGSTQQMEIKNVPVGKIWYFAVKTLNGKGQGSAISNLPSLQDSRPLTTAGSTCTETSPYECTVAAKDDWLQTSLFVHKGDTFSITYLSGTWSIDIWQESLDNPWGSYISPYFDAEGSSEADSKQCGIVDTTSLSTLIGKIGNSPAFKVGNAKTMVATTDGNVFLRMNDTCQGDNDGAVVMKLAALRLITGKVTDGHGNPLVGVVVRLTDPSGHPVRIRRVDGTVIPELRTNTSNDGRYTITDEISLGTYKLEVLLEDTTGHKRVLYDILQQPVFIRTPIDIAANHQKYVQDFRLASEEKFETPLVDGYRDRLADLAAIYFQAWKVEDFIVNTLGYHSYKPIAYVRAFYDGEGANAQHFAKQPFEDSYINLPSNLSHLHYHEDWSSRILWHENFHHLQWQLSQDSFYDVPNFTGQHKGFRNATTRDSWVEGWAEFWTCVLADDRLFPVIAQQNILEPIDVTLEGIVSVSWINLEDNYKTWDFDENGTFGRESFAVAGILWDLYDSQNTLFDKDNIDLSRQNLGDFLLDTKTITNVYDLYQRMQAKLVGTPNEEGTTRVSASDLEQIFIQHGFYADVEWNQPPAWSDVWGRFQYHHHNTGEEAGWGGRPARRYSPPAIPGAFLKLTQAASLSANTTLTVTLSFDQPYYDYSYTVEAPGPSALIYVEPPPTRTLALVTVTASNGAQTSQPFTIDNQTYWQRVAESTTGYAAETTLTLAAANSPEVPIAGLRAVLSTVVVAGESAALAATADAGSAVTYTWDFGDGTNGEGAIVQHTYAAAGDYTATVTASNALSTVTQRVAVMVHAAAPVSEPTSVSPDRAAESGSSNAIPQTDDAPPVLAPIVAVLPPAVRPYWLAIGGGGAALVVLVLAGILWQGRARRARLARVVSTPAAQRRPAPPIAPPPSAPPPTLAPPSAPQPPADDLLQGLLANTPVPPPSAPADLPQALAAIKRGDLDAGSTLLREVTAREPGNADAWLNLGIIAVRRRDWDNARRCGLVARQLGHPQADTFLVWLHQQEAK